MPPAPSVTRRRFRARRARIVGVVLALALVICAGTEAAAAGQASAEKALDRFESAWEGASAASVTALMEPKGTLRVKLLKPRSAGGTWTLDQAKRGLAAYFGSRGISNPKLKDVTPRTNRQKTVRVYEYTYRPHGDDVQTTRLTVTVKQDVADTWVLASVIESPKP